MQRSSIQDGTKHMPYNMNKYWNIYMILIYIHNILLYILVKSSSRPVFDPFLGWMMLDVKSKGCQCWQLFVLEQQKQRDTKWGPASQQSQRWRIHSGRRDLNWSCLVVYLPLWKMWVRQLGWLNSQYMEKSWKIKFMFQTTNQLHAWSCDHVIMCTFCKPQTQSLNEVWVGRLHRVHQG